MTASVVLFAARPKGFSALVGPAAELDGAVEPVPEVAQPARPPVAASAAAARPPRRKSRRCRDGSEWVMRCPPTGALGWDAAGWCAGRAGAGVARVPGRSRAAPDPPGVALLEGGVVLVAARDVRGEVEGWSPSVGGDPLGDADGQQLGDVRSGDRGDRADGDAAVTITGGRPPVDP